MAQQHFDNLFVFGDSYADLTLSDHPASNPLAPPGVSLPSWRVYPVPLADKLGIKDSQIVDVAVGGATASPNGSPPKLLQDLFPDPFKPGNLPDQVAAFLATNPSFSFGPRDLVTISIGGNDFLQLFATSGMSPSDFGKATAALTTDQIEKLVGAGARTFVIAGFSGMSNLGVIPDPFKPLSDAYASAYFNALQTELLPDAQKGARFFMLDVFKLGQQALLDPRYGFTITKFNGTVPVESRCPGSPLAPCDGSITTQDKDPSKYLLGPDGLHLTNAGFDLVGRYMANIVLAPSTIGVQPDVVSATTGGFVQSVLGRLDATRVAREAAGVAGSGGDGPMGLGRQDKSRAPQGAPAAGPLTAYTMGTILGGNQGESSALVGYDYDARSGTVGIEYSINRNLIFGIAGNYTTTNADLDNHAGIDVNAVQGAAYLSYATRNAFAEALAAYGSHDVDLSRPGILDPVRSSTDATSVAAAVRGGYLFDVGALRAGPIAGLTYLHTRLDGYEESGDPLLTFKVSSQTLDSVAFNLGLRFLAPFQAGGSTVVPYLNVMLEQQFGDPTRTLTASLSQAPLLPILTPIANFEDSTYGKVEGGVTFQLGPALSATVNAATTFARSDERDFYVNAGLNYRF
ncbi:MAG TPA: autotransporter domain-containing protein [Hyphomicrobiaceae bacterium]